jgi:hypothetical protein
MLWGTLQILLKMLADLMNSVMRDTDRELHVLDLIY